MSASTFNSQGNKHSSLNTAKRNTGMAPPTEHINSKGNKIKVGDTVRVLSTGLFKGNRVVVTKLGRSRISLKLASGRSTNQKSTNLEVITTDV